MRKLQDGTVFCAACDSNDDSDDSDNDSSGKCEVTANPLPADSCQCRDRSGKRDVMANPLKANTCECRVGACTVTNQAAVTAKILKADSKPKSQTTSTVPRNTSKTGTKPKETSLPKSVE